MPRQDRQAQLEWLAQGVGDLPVGLAGVDEAGRGPLAGPVYAAAVMLDPDRPIIGLDDSKRLTARQRDGLAAAIRDQAAACAIGTASVAEIDALNILQATLLAMRRAVEALPLMPSAVWADGLFCPPLALPMRALVEGDRRVAAISAASILAKTARDAAMLELEAHYPGYGFARHKGYGTPQHLRALRELGPCPEHRLSFAPVREAAQRARTSARPTPRGW
ncbi:MAG: ribonuclease HII [Burkholderiales bacterium]|nr:MAG: ribonuclease HII [Burkholderiales bacterium]